MESAGVDLVVASGLEAGGHRPSFLKPAEESMMGTFALVPLIADKVSVPVIAAGGIADGRGIVAALTLGADAVQIGTAILACDESGASPLHRRLLFGDDAKYTGLSRAYTGRLARGVYNRFASAKPQAAGGTNLPNPSNPTLTMHIFAPGRPGSLVLDNDKA